MNKKLSYVCYGLAGVVMASALVYYNFIDKKKLGAGIGDSSPDFTVATMAAEGDTFQMTEKTYNLYENEGKVRVINFWATWCTPCKEELPEFDEFAKKYPNVDVIVMCGGSGDENTVITWMNNPEYDAQQKGWKDYTFTFGYDKDQIAYNAMGAELFPTTVIVDEDNVIRYTAGKKVTFESLEKVVTSLLND